MMLKKAALVGAIACLLAGAGAGVASALIAPPGGGGGLCQPGDISYTYEVTHPSKGWTMSVHIYDSGGCSIEAYVHCRELPNFVTYFNPKPQGTGDVIGTGLTTETCPYKGDALYGHSGYEYYDGSSWTRVELYSA